MWQRFLPFPSIPLEVGSLLQVEGLGSALARPAVLVFGEFQAKNLASGSHDLQEFLRK